MTIKKDILLNKFIKQTLYCFVFISCPLLADQPPIIQPNIPGIESKNLTPEQAMYHFLSGYTAKVAGTEIGLSNEPQATFSTCFGAPFMPRNPIEYGNLLKDKISKFLNLGSFYDIL